MNDGDDTECPCCNGTGRFTPGRVEPMPGPNRSLQNAFALVAANLEAREARRRYAETQTAEDLAAMDQADQVFGDLVLSVLRESPGGTIAELAQLVGTSFLRLGEHTGKLGGMDFLRAIAAMYQGRDWQGGQAGRWDEDD